MEEGEAIMREIHTKIICDICGKEIDANDIAVPTINLSLYKDGDKFSFSGAFYLHEDGSRGSAYFDVCRDCYLQLLKTAAEEMTQEASDNNTIHQERIEQRETKK